MLTNVARVGSSMSPAVKQVWARANPAQRINTIRERLVHKRVVNGIVRSVRMGVSILRRETAEFSSNAPWTVFLRHAANNANDKALAFNCTRSALMVPSL